MLIDPKSLWLIFFTAFLAEFGDKSQVLAFVYGADKSISPFWVFATVAAALVLVTAIGVFAGNMLSGWLNEKIITWATAVFFLLVGAATLWKAVQIH